MPLWSFGLLAFGPFMWLAITRRRRSDEIIMMAYIAATATAIGLVSWEAMTSANGAAGGGLLTGLMLFGAVHTLVACRPGRRDSSGRPVLAKVDRNIQAVSGAEDRMNARNRARKLARKDPALARELRIGRPDLPRDYDDGGLVDVNHVPSAVLVSHLKLTGQQAAKVVSVRNEIDRFDGPVDLESFCGLPPQLIDELSDLIIFG